jgi:hypothetical protein
VGGGGGLSYWPARLHRLAKSIPRNRCLGSINFYKYGFWKLATISLYNPLKSPVELMYINTYRPLIDTALYVLLLMGAV